MRNLVPLVLAGARGCLSETGAAGLSLEIIADKASLGVEQVRECFPHRDDLLTALVIGAYDASGAAMEAADRDALARGCGSGERLLAVARALRAWSVACPGEFALIYGSPVPGYHAPVETVAAASRTPAALAAVLGAALRDGDLVAPARPLAGPSLVTDEAVMLFGGVPAEPFGDLIERGIVLWGGLIGLLVFQVFNRTHDSVLDEERFFDRALAVLAETVGLTVRPGGGD